MALHSYKLYHTTTRNNADEILSWGFTPSSKRVELSNSPWMIGTKGDTVVEITITLNYDPNSAMAEVSFHPESRQWCHVDLRHDQLNRCKSTFRILPTDEKNALRLKYQTPGEPTLRDREVDD